MEHLVCPSLVSRCWEDGRCSILVGEDVLGSHCLFSIISWFSTLLLLSESDITKLSSLFWDNPLALTPVYGKACIRRSYINWWLTIQSTYHRLGYPQGLAGLHMYENGPGIRNDGHFDRMESRCSILRHLLSSFFFFLTTGGLCKTLSINWRGRWFGTLDIDH